MKSLRVWWPVILLAALAAMFARGLDLDPRRLPSARVGQAAPAFTLPLLEDPAQQLTPESLRGRVWVMNVFASWCGACGVEHPLWLALAAQNKVPLIGLAYKDTPQNARDWLAHHGGNPYQRVALDQDGRVAIDYGVYGVPETYVIDAQGIIRYRHVGPIDARFFEQHVAPWLGAKP